MALIACTECQKQISDAAKTCPHCGKPTTANTTKSTGNWKWVGIFVLIMMGLVFAAKNQEKFRYQSEAIDRSLGVLRAKLNDPESAIFKDVYETRDGDVCGEVNAKNLSGGYVGYKFFVVTKLGEVQIGGGVDDPLNINNMEIMSDCLDRKRY